VADPVLRRPGEGETVFDSERSTLRLLVELEELTVTWFRYAPGEKGPDPHIHHRHTDAFYVLEGELELALGPGAAEIVRATAGTFVAAPPVVVHTFRNASSAEAVFLNFHAPSMGFADMLRARRDGQDEDAERFDQSEPPPDGGRPVSEAVVSRAEGGELFDRGDRAIGIKSDLPQISAFDIAFDPEFVVDPHTHDDHVDSFYVLAGEVDFTVGDGEARAAPGAWYSAPPGFRHGFRNPGPGRARVLNVHTPDGGFTGRVRGG
jgi:quercetin dioxygenase-like cupin family protein